MSGGPLVIVGDALLDRDVDGRAGRFCPGAPAAPVIEDAVSTPRPGGAALAALLAVRPPARDGAEVVLVTPLGTDPASMAVREILGSQVTVVPLPLEGPLQQKTRVRVDGRTLLRVDTAAGTPGRPGRLAFDAIMSAGAILVSDYGHGAADAGPVRDALTRRAGQAPLVWDPHPKGTIPVSGTMLVTPNEAEARAACADASAGTAPGQDASRQGARGIAAMAAAAERLLRHWPAQAVAVTMAEHGALLAQRGQPPLAVAATPVPAADPCGAGDRFAVAVAAALRDGSLLSEAVTSAVSVASGYLADGGVSGIGAPAPAAAEPSCADHGVLVAAGGCFDVLHAGHVSMLRAARRLGDRLVVCLNSDASVRRLKGPGRPVNPARDRAAVLCALGCVDDVVVFDEDTPERALTRLRPDIWVKGGDYDGRELPEAAALRRWGGLAVTVPYLAGRSTSRILTPRDAG